MVELQSLKVERYRYSKIRSSHLNQAKGLLDQKFDFWKYKDFKTRYKVNTTFKRYFGVVTALVKLKKSLPDQVTMNSEDQLSSSQKLLSSSNVGKEAYTLIVKGITSAPDKSQSKWIADCKNYEKFYKLG